MPWLNSKSPYNSILRHIKEKGIRVYHRQMKNGAGGLFDCRQTIITIDKEFRETWAGCYLLLHELSHWYQYREGKYIKFFETKLENTEENHQLVLEAEFGAINGAIKLLKMWNVSYIPSESTEKGKEEAIKFYMKYYFGRV